MERSRLEAAIEEFQSLLPYTQGAYASRAWGHKLHSLCSYQGKFKPAMAHWLVKSFSTEGGRVLDPLGGVGTVPFEAALLGRRAITNDKSPLAATVGAAKMSPPSLDEALEQISRLEKRMLTIDLSAEDLVEAEFGLNASVSAYYHPETLLEVLKARKVFMTEGVQGDAFMWASLLHVLHGNRPYALSRTSHPITPFNPTGAYVYKSLIERLQNRVTSALAAPLPPSFLRGEAFHGDFRDLPDKIKEPVDTIITSPPFIGMRFDRPNWLRMWFCGWQATDFHTKSLDFLERQQTKSTSVYIEFFTTCAQLLKPGGVMAVHIGSGGRGDLVGDLRQLGKGHLELVGETVENVEQVSNHGLKDKGLTKHHHMLFFQRA
ncbi:hypothetical protein ABZ078_14780 [Streptomyces sp. NPDC006385]|uniref:hypothetical protein n=1 Tax=Streptomyces sp. NPDC006385 TaxID=3156761 RepID=UPI0033A3F0F1